MRSTTDDSPIAMMATTELMMPMFWFSERSTPGGVGPQAPELDIFCRAALLPMVRVSAGLCPAVEHARAALRLRRNSQLKAIKWQRWCCRYELAPYWSSKMSV